MDLGRITALGSHSGQCARRPAEVRAAGREEGHPGHLQRRRPHHAKTAIKTFAQLYGAKFPKAVKKITHDQAELLAFFNFPAEHQGHLRTTNPIESTFATVRPRTKLTRCAGSRIAVLAMVSELVESDQQRWRAVNAPHLVALVRAGAPSNAVTSSNAPKPARHEGSQPTRTTPPVDRGHERGKRARMASMQVSRDVGPPNRRRS